MPANSELERLAQQATVVRQYLHEFDKVNISYCYFLFLFPSDVNEATNFNIILFPPCNRMHIRHFH